MITMPPTFLLVECMMFLGNTGANGLLLEFLSGYSSGAENYLTSLLSQHTPTKEELFSFTKEQHNMSEF